MLPCLPILFLLLCGGDRPGDRASDRTAGAASTEWLTLAELPAGAPETLSVVVPLAGRTARLDLRRHSLRAPDAFVRIVGPAGRPHDEPPPPARTYRGVVHGEPDSIVLGSLGPDGLEALIVLPNGQRLRLAPARVPGLDARVHSVRPEPEPEPFACGSDDHEWEPEPGIVPRGGQELVPRCLSLAEIAFDADFEYFQAKGSSSANVVVAIDAILNEVEYFYARDVQITYALTAYVVRTAPFYAPTSGGTLLEQFRAEWNTNQGGIRRDMAHLMTGKPGSLIEFGGLAWVGVVCTASQYGWSMDGANIVGHEVGHNWGAGHCHDPSPCNNMCGACFNVGPVTRRIIEAFRDSRTCLERVQSYPTALPPYTAPEGIAQRKDAVDTLGPVRIDVLANDDDGNCEPLAIAGVDPTSERGGTVRIVPAAVPVGGQVLEYTLPPTPFVGSDRFTYLAGDGNLASPGHVTVDLAPLEVLSWYPLDDALGTQASDRSGHGYGGTTTGAPTWTTGVAGGALLLDGVDDEVVCPALGLASNQVTLTAWIRRDGTQSNNAGLIYCRDGSTAAGLQFGSANTLRYNWNADPETWGWDSGLVVPDGQWVFVALVVEPERATLWLDDGVTRTSATNVHRHAPEAFDGPLRLGRDAGGTRYFRGALDEVRVYPYALSADEIGALADTFGPADAPLPPDGGTRFEGAALSWAPSPGATLHRVYLGTDWAAVRDATVASPEYLGDFAAAVDPGALAQGPTWFWRVDELAPESVRGPVWQFTQASFHRWGLDETSGATAFEATGPLHGTYQNGVVLGQPGATAGSGTSVFFDGVNDRVQIPALDLNSDRVTITAWVRRQGSQNPWAGLVFCRAGTTTAGLNLGEANELRYHWNGAGNTWGWNSGLIVPDDTWVFTALVVEPQRARLFLGQGGALTSATNVVTHPAEAFDGILTLGRDPNSTARTLHGWLDDVRVYDGVLTRAQLEALYLGP
jgi:hypothetical protein